MKFDKKDFGIDVSSSQKDAKWNIVSKEVSYVYIKSTEGTGFLSESVKFHADGCKKNGIDMFGYYHFAHPEKNSPDKEALWFLKNLAKLPAGKLLPVLDCEKGGEKSKPDEKPVKYLNPEQLTDWVMTFYNILDKMYNKPSPMYTGRKYTDRFIKGKGLETHPLWVSHYNSTIKEPRIYLDVWPTWDMWQYSSTARVRGIDGDCDVNICRNGLSRFLI